MFHFIAGAIAAWNQVGLMLGGALCARIGALLLGSRLHWRLRATRVAGTVVGVRQTGKGTFFPVYRYTLPNGVNGEATSDTGSTATDNMITGRTADIFVFPEHPDRTTEAQSHFQEVVGALCVSAGLVILYIALTSWPFTRYTLGMLAGMVLYGVGKFRRFIPAPGDRPRGSLASTLLRRNLNSAPVTPIEKLVNTEEVEEQQEKQRLSIRKMAPFVTLCGIAMLVLTFHLARVTARLESGGLRTTGTVVSLALESNSDSSTYHAVVRFTDASGAVVEFRDSVGSSPPSHQVGDIVNVLYLPGEADASATIDRGVWNWIAPVAVGLFGTLLLFVGGRIRRNRSESLNPRPLASRY